VARLHALLALFIAASAIGACGGDEDGGTAKAPARPAITTLPGDPGTGLVDRAAVDVVRRWSDALRHGDVAGATALFAIPSRAFNGDGVVRLNSAADARAFNESLPCGARLTTVEPSAHGYFIATFTLTERPGHGRCGSGPTDTARTAFRVRGGKITDWIRVGDLPKATGTPA
jgi:hypothetical protein